MPTDLDTTMKMSTNVSTPDAHAFDTVLFTHWMPDSLDADPWVTGDAAGAVADLGEWWSTRDADVRAQLG
jgi:hypothetical protein